MGAVATQPVPAVQLRRLEPSSLGWAEARAHLEAYAQSLGVDLSPQGFAEELRDLPAAYPRPGGVWLAEQAGRVVGSVALRPLGEGAMEVKRLFVLPSARGLGVGRALMEVVLRAAREASATVLRLDTLPGMEAAQALYRAMGFRPIAPYSRTLLPGGQCFELALDVSPG